MIKRLLATAAAGLVALGMTVLAQAPAGAVVAPVSITLTNVQSGKCADVLGFNQDNLAPVVQWDCNGLANQKFTAEDRGAGQFALKGFNGKCLDIQDSSLNNNAKLVMFDCHYAANQRFYIERQPVGAVNFTLRAVHSNKCLENQASLEQGKALLQFECHHGANQLWK